MHELAIAKGIIDIVNDESAKQGFTHVEEIRLCVGEYSGVVPECLNEFFPYAAKGSPAEGAALTVRVPKTEFLCAECGYRGEIDRREAKCPVCGGTALRMTGGREFYVESLVVSENKE